jgi:hypothetical protein
VFDAKLVLQKLQSWSDPLQRYASSPDGCERVSLGEAMSIVGSHSHTELSLLSVVSGVHPCGACVAATAYTSSTRLVSAVATRGAGGEVPQPDRVIMS